MAQPVPLVRVSLVREAGPSAPLADAIRTPADAARVLVPLLRDADRETLLVLLLDTPHRPIGAHVVSVGTLDAAPAHPREVFKAAILANAAAVILAHNHPSGDVTPSRADVAMYKRLHDAGALLGIPVLDSLIIGQDAYRSIRAGDAMQTEEA